MTHSFNRSEGMDETKERVRRHVYFDQTTFKKMLEVGKYHGATVSALFRYLVSQEFERLVDKGYIGNDR